jgi:glucosamine--fructose-6-phosphate aminotransferase (isomerizing)
LQQKFALHRLLGKAIAISESNLNAMLEFSGKVGYTTLLGRGPSVASALGGALLLKETTKVPAEGANAGQFRHGAIEIISPDSFAIMFSPRGTSSRLNLQLTAQLEKSGAHILFIGAADGHQPSSRLILEIVVPNEFLAPLFEIVPLQLLSYALALKVGIQPGTFKNTTPVVLTR